MILYELVESVKISTSLCKAMAKKGFHGKSRCRLMFNRMDDF